MADKLPAWYTPESQPQPQAAANAPLPSWYTPEPGGKPPAAPDQDYGVAKNFLTGLLRIPGAVLGAPAMLEHTKNWADAKMQNGINALVSAAGGTPLPDATGASIDKTDPIYNSLPTSEGVDKRVFGTLGMTPYEPTSPLGKAGQVAVTAGGAGLLDPVADLSLARQAPTLAKGAWETFKALAPNVGKSAAAGAAAQGSQQALPDTPGLAALAALVTHGGLGAGSSLARKGYNTFAKPLVNPKAAAAPLAGAALEGLDNTQPGMAAPSVLDVNHARDATRQSTDVIGPGLDNYSAGENIRSDLQSRKSSLLAGRKSAADNAYDAFRAEQPLEGAKLGAFMGRPSFRMAVKAASGDVLDEGGKPLTDFWDFNEAGDPKLRPNAAVPPDVLDRVKGKLDDAVNAAPAGSRTQRTAGILRDQFRDMLDREYASTYPKTRADFAAASRPLDPLEQGPAAKVLDSDTRFGRTTYSMPQERIADTFLTSRAQRSDFDNLLAASGGDRAAALGNLQENLTHKVQGAINSDGTLSLDAFNRAVKPYAQTLNMWFPELAQKFSSAEAAQRTLETVQAQKSLVDDIAQGGLRGGGEVVTRATAQKWLAKNEDMLAKTQSKGAIMRLKQLADGLPDAPFRAPEAAAEAAPMATGAALAALTGGKSAALEGGVLGGIMHSIPGFFTAPRLSAVRNTYSSMVERAFSDPAFAQQLSADAMKHRVSLRDMLMKNALSAAAIVPAATNAAAPQ